MRKRTLTAALIMVLFTALPVCADEGRWVSFVNDQPAGAPMLDLVSSGPQGLTLSVTIPGMTARQVDHREGVFTALEMPDCAKTQALGHAGLPLIRKFIEVPYDASVAIEVSEMIFETLNPSDLGFAGKILPIQPPVPKIPGAAEAMKFVLDQDYYKSNRFHPTSPVRLAGDHIIRGHRVVALEIMPVAYNPSSGAIRATAEITLNIRFTGGDLDATMRETDRVHSASFDRMIDDMVLNYGDVVSSAGRKGITSGAEGLLIITPDEAVPALADLVAWKERKGFKVEVAPKSVTGSTTTAIKNYIQGAYNSWSGPALTYVMLVGDTNYIPTFSTGSHAADLYYTTLSGTDFLPEVYIGRISGQTLAQIEDILDKTLVYEKAEFAGGDWIKAAAFIGTCDSSNYTIAEGTHNYCISNHMDPEGYGSDKLYCITYNATTAQAKAAVNDGRSLLIYSGHGYEGGWAAPSGGFDQSDVTSLANGDMLPFVTSHACTTAPINQGSEVYGETWVRKGAIGFWGASNSTYWDEDDVLQKGMFDAVYDDAYHTFGEMVERGLNAVYQQYGSASNTEYYYEVYHLLADPTLELWTDSPGGLDVSYPPMVPIGMTNVTVTVTDAKGTVEGALVCLMKADDAIHEVGLTDASGSVTIPLNPAPASIGDLLVTVTKHDRVPYEGSAIVGSTGDGSISLDHEIYACDETVSITVADMDLEGAGQIDVDLETAVAGDAETMTLDEIGPNMGVFTGSIDLEQATAATGDGLLQSNQADTITATYIDADDGEGGTNVPKTAEADTDCVAPVISNVMAVDVSDTGARIIWTTDEPATSLVRIGETIPPTTIEGSGDLTTSHSVDLSGLDTGVTYYFEVSSDDALGNTGLDDNGGDYYSLTTLYRQTIFKDDLEAGAPGWSHSGARDEWELGDPSSPGPNSAHTVSNCWATDLDDEYNDYTGASGPELAMFLHTPDLDLSVVLAPEVSFYDWLQIEGGSYDYASVEIRKASDDALLGVLVENYQSNHSSWALQEFSLAPYAGETVYLRFNVYIDSSVNEAGWYIDDIELTGVLAGCDVDGDGYESAACGEDDCNDYDADINPGATEVCDSIDNDCDGNVDEGFDTDGDSWTTCGNDCDDTDPAINPDAAEDCFDGVDNDCDALVDDADPDCYVPECTDDDGDGFAVEGGECGLIDCDDANFEVNPGHAEVPDNGIDDNCNGQVDEGCFISMLTM